MKTATFETSSAAADQWNSYVGAASHFAPVLLRALLLMLDTVYPQSA